MYLQALAKKVTSNNYNHQDDLRVLLKLLLASIAKYCHKLRLTWNNSTELE
jgi:hypothetical protein